MTVESAVAALAAGHVVGMPTDTVYGIGADPWNEEAVGRLFELKGRPVGKPVGLLVAGRNQAVEIGEIRGWALRLAEEHWPGPLTLVVTPRVILADWVGDQQLRTVGIRVPDHPVALDLLQRAGPLAVTSANRSGEPEARDHLEAEAVFGGEVAVYLEGTCPGGDASTVIDATSPEPKVLRQGPVKL